MPRLKCAYCGKNYGRRNITSETVRWSSPTKQVTTTSGGSVTVLDGPATPAPAYRGNGIVVKEHNAYLSADNGRMVMTRDIWDGETWIGGYAPFCTLRCALAYARAAYAAARKPLAKRRGNRT